MFVFDVSRDPPFVQHKQQELTRYISVEGVGDLEEQGQAPGAVDKAIFLKVARKVWGSEGGRMPIVSGNQVIDDVFNLLGGHAGRGAPSTSSTQAGAEVSAGNTSQQRAPVDALERSGGERHECQPCQT